MYDRPQRGFSRSSSDSRDSRTPQITHRNIRATVKWFNPTKGFGFITPDDGSPDAFLHASVVQFLGYDNLPEGTTVVCDLSQGGKGPQVAALHEVDTSTASTRERAPRADFGSRDRGDSGPTETVEGTVKWFNATKGFGFISPIDNGKDVFIHANALQRAGLYELAEGAQVRMSVRQGQKGPEAVSVELI